MTESCLIENAPELAPSTVSEPRDTISGRTLRSSRGSAQRCVRVVVVAEELVATGVRTFLEPYSSDIVVDDPSIHDRAGDVRVFLLGPEVLGVEAITTIRQKHATDQSLRIARFVDRCSDVEPTPYAVAVDLEIPMSISASGLSQRLLRLASAPTTISSGDRFMLTVRECEVLTMLVTGATNKEIATVLDMAIDTVKTHVRHVSTKLDVTNRTAAALRARELGLA